jgi:pimeloyl-ACP methyl ester carboxylesterase
MDGESVLTQERILRLGADRHLFAIASEPSPMSARRYDTAILLLNAGIIHTAGPSGLYVRLARQLAADGYLVVRFDFSGIGESEARRDGLAPEPSSLCETQEVMDYLAETYGVRRFVAAGICSGAVTAFRVAVADERIVGLALLNPQGYFPSAAGPIGAYVQAQKDQHYLLSTSIRRRESWLRLLRGEVDLTNLLRALTSRFARPFLEHGAERRTIKRLAGDFAVLCARGIRILPIYAAGDPGLIELALIIRGLPATWRNHPGFQPMLIAGSDHLFTPLHGQRRLLELLRSWLDLGSLEPIRCRPRGERPAVRPPLPTA